MYGLRRRILSQNFLHDRALVTKLVRRSSIGKNDLVIDIGAGAGIITQELLYVAQNVIAVEIDITWCERLVYKFGHNPRFRLIDRDILKYRLPKHSYKVFANIPFSIEGKIIRRLLNAPNPPDDAYLVMRADLAHRLIRRSQFAVFYQPWFDFRIEHGFRKTDFHPAATMDTVLIRITKNSHPLLPVSDKKRFMLFVGQGFGGGKNLEYNLRPYLSHLQLKRLGGLHGFSPRMRPADLTTEQWIAVFIYAAKFIPDEVQ